mmetsp:Transcript_97921/g.261318  ORF Transcript_97921/g.261318 Transcript_97921/m.261318 type:complete len:273 (+) Transcript_97921:1743-2561(+)
MADKQGTLHYQNATTDGYNAYCRCSPEVASRNFTRMGNHTPRGDCVPRSRRGCQPRDSWGASHSCLSRTSLGLSDPDELLAWSLPPVGSHTVCLPFDPLVLEMSRVGDAHVHGALLTSSQDLGMSIVVQKESAGNALGHDLPLHPHSFYDIYALRTLKIHPGPLQSSQRLSDTLITVGHGFWSGGPGFHRMAVRTLRRRFRAVRGSHGEMLCTWDVNTDRRVILHISPPSRQTDAIHGPPQLRASGAAITGPCIAVICTGGEFRTVHRTCST